MLNEKKYETKSWKVILFLIVLESLGCGRGTMVLPKEEDKAAVILESKGYRINQNRFKPGQHIKYIEINKKTIYKTGDLESICNISTLEGIKFEKISFPVLTGGEIMSCSNSKLEEFLFFEVKVESNSICRVLKAKKNPGLAVTFFYSTINKNLIDCLSELESLTSFGLDGDLNFTDDDFCAFSKKSKNLTFLRLNYSNLGKKSLECILNFPKLTSVMLQDWKNVPMAEHFKIMDAYEKKYGRKIEKLINDTY
jgi:hypothetical protein